MSGIKVEYELTDGGSTGKLTSATGLLKKNMDEVVTSATKASVAVKAAMAPSGGSKTKAALQGATMSPQEGIEYGQARAAVGTGAASRDFAKQAQGLGGLVHVYATFAANLFAVSAAFTALKNAADTTNMVKGLDQLGARSGIALGNLSKRVVELTDNAVSLRDAMTSTAQATSGGMTSQNLERLAVVAKKAGDALGIGAADALSRLSRGITKIEPELLDELGIFVRVDTAVGDYALSVGKAASSLTDFERRQAFALAVLKQGEDKFNNIEIDANPYQKLLATIQNVAQGVLSTINSVLGPLAKYLADSPSMVLAGLTVVTGYLLKQAIPAIQQYSASIQASTNKENQAIKAAQEARLNAYNEQKNQLVQLTALDLDAKAKANEAAIDSASKIEKLALGSKSRYAGAVRNILSSAETYQDITPEQLSVIDKLGEKQTKVGKLYKELALSIRAAQAAHDAETLAIENSTAAKAALTKATKAEIDAKLALAKVNTQLALSAAKVSSLEAFDAKGLISGVSTLFGELSKIQGSWLDKFKAGFGGIAGLAGAQFGKLLGAINPVVGGITAAMTVFQLADGVFANNAKSVSKLNSSIDSLEGAIESASRTAQTFNTLDISKVVPLERLKASTNALQELSTNFNTVIADLKIANANANAWDKFWDGALIPIGKDLKSKTSKQLSLAIAGAISTAPEGPAKEEFKSKIQAITGIDTINIDALNKAFDSMEPDKYLAAIAKGGEDFKAFQQATSVATAKVVELDTAFDATQKSFDVFAASMQNSSPLSTFANNLVLQSQKIVGALEEPEKAFENLAKLAKEPKKLSLLDPKTLADIQQAQPVIERINKELEQAKKELSTRQTEKLEGKATFETAGLIARAKAQVEELSKQAANMATYFLEAIKADGFKTAAKIYGKEIVAATEEASLAIARAKTGLLTDEVAVKEQGRITELQIQSNIKLVESNRDLIKAHYLSIAQMKEDSANRTLSDRTVTDPAKIAAATTAVAEATVQKALLNSTDAFSVYTSIQSGGTATQKSAANEIFPQLQNLAGFTKELIKLGGQLTANRISTDIAAMGARQTRTTKDLDESLKIKQSELERLQATRQIVGYADQEALTREKVLADYIAQEKSAKTIKDLEEKKGAVGNTAQKAIYQTQIEQATAAAKADANKREFEYSKLAYDMAIVSAKRESDREADRLAQLNHEKTIQQEIADIKLQSSSQVASYTESARVYLQYELDTAKAKLAYETQLNEARRQQAEKFAEFDAKRQQLATLPLQTGETQDDRAAKVAELNKQENDYIALQGASNGRLREGYQLALDKLGISKEANMQQSKYNDLLAASTSAAESLKAIFGTIGSAMGNVVTSFAQAAVNLDKSSKALEDLKTKQADLIANKKDTKEIDDQITKQTKKNQKDEISGYANIAGAAKGMFKEKTFAYKAFSALEKGLHVARLAMDVTEMISDKTKLAGKIASNIAGAASDVWAAGVSAVKAVINAISSMPFPLNIAAGAATAAVVYGLLSSIGGKGGSSPTSAGFAPNSEQRQETQGTGMTWDSQGNKVETGGGVFGDSSAQSKSIANSLEILKNNSIEGLDYDNKMLRAMTKLSDALTGASQAIYAIPGLRQGGKGFGTLAGSSSSKGSAESFLSDIPLVGGVLGGVAGKIFGGGTSVTASIESAGIQLRGSLQQIIDDTAGSIVQYKDVLRQFHEDGGWFGSDDDWTTRTRETDAVKENVQSSIKEVFVYSKELFTDIGEMAGVTSDTINSAFKSINFAGLEGDIDIIGMTGQEALDAINAVISTKLDDTARLLFSQFDQYKKFGEGYLETVVRVVDGNNKVDQALRSMGHTFDVTTGGIEKFAQSETLIKLAGGLENFMDQAKFFADNFLSETERLIPVQKSVAAELTRLNIPLNISREGFKKLVQAQDLSTKAGQELYQSLMDLAPGFDAATKTMNDSLTETVSKFRDFAKSLKDFRDSLVIGGSSPLTPLEKYSQAKLDFETTYAKALTGDTTALSKLQSTSQSYLDLSKTVNASSEKYVQDFNSVLEALDTASVSSAARADVAQLQLTALTTQVDLLTTINNNIALIAGVPALAGGGRSSGLTLVGELGPELVDFSTPGRVYTADQTAGMFSAPTGASQSFGAMVAEIRNLKDEVTQLRREQQKQTGDIIISNYEANQRNAEDVASAVEESTSSMLWQDRTQSVIK